MRILLSNDDGIHAPGLAALYAAVRDLGEVYVVAPEAERSAVGHAITIYDPLKTRRVEIDGAFSGVAVDGTPADCVKLAVSALLPGKPDLIVSGINLGPNAGVSIIYSGTVSAATEGVILGIPSMAVSLDTFKNPHWETAARVARDLAVRLAARPLPRDTLLNVNVPNLPWDRLAGLRATRMGRSRFDEVFDRRVDPRGNVYYWMDGEMCLLDDPVGTDLQAMKDGFVSLTPLWFDLTHTAALPDLQRWMDEPPQG